MEGQTHTHTHSHTGTNGVRSSPSISLMKWLPKMDDMTSPPPPITISPLKNLPLKAAHHLPPWLSRPISYCTKWTMSFPGPILPPRSTFIGRVIYLFNAIGWSGCLWMRRASKSWWVGVAPWLKELWFNNDNGTKRTACSPSAFRTGTSRERLREAWGRQFPEDIDDGEIRALLYKCK